MVFGQEQPILQRIGASERLTYSGGDPTWDHMRIEIPPKFTTASVIRFLNGKGAIANTRQFEGKLRNFTGEHFWAQGDAALYSINRWI